MDTNQGGAVCKLNIVYVRARAKTHLFFLQRRLWATTWRKISLSLCWHFMLAGVKAAIGTATAVSCFSSYSFPSQLQESTEELLVLVPTRRMGQRRGTLSWVNRPSKHKDPWPNTARMLVGRQKGHRWEKQGGFCCMLTKRKGDFLSWEGLHCG